MGTPFARLFFEPQKTMVISSAREKPRRLVDHIFKLRTMARSPMQATKSQKREAGLTVVQSPAITDSLKAV